MFGASGGCIAPDVCWNVAPVVLVFCVAVVPVGFVFVILEFFK